MGTSLNRESALYEFWNSFGVPAFVVSNVPDQKERPVAYIDYENQMGDFLSAPMQISVNVWYRTASEKKINNIVREIEQKIDLGGCVVEHEKGAIWIKRSQPWCQVIKDEDPEIKRRYLMVSIEDWRI